MSRARACHYLVVCNALGEGSDPISSLSSASKKTMIDTLHKECKSQEVIIERGGCSQSAISKHIKYKVDWKEEIG